MSLLILTTAFYLNFVLGLLGVTQSISSVVQSLHVSPTVLLWALAMLALVVEVYRGGLWLKLAALVVMALLSGAVYLHRRRRIRVLRG